MPVDIVDAPAASEIGPTSTTAGNRAAPDSTTAEPFTGGPAAHRDLPLREEGRFAHRASPCKLSSAGAGRPASEARPTHGWQDAGCGC